MLKTLVGDLFYSLSDYYACQIQYKVIAPEKMPFSVLSSMLDELSPAAPNFLVGRFRNQNDDEKQV